MSSKIGGVAIEIKQAEKQSKIYTESMVKEQIAITKAQCERVLKQFKDEMFQADLAKQLAQTVLKSTKTKCENKKNEIYLMKNPSIFKTEVPKDYLASEKLASTKKKTSLSPIKANPKPLSGKTSRRNRSTAKTFRPKPSK
jgi:hypothetical protein